MPDFASHAKHFEDSMRAAGRAERTVASYLTALTCFDRFLKPRSLDDASAGDIVAYRLDLGSRGRGPSSQRMAHYALRFFYREVLGHRDWDYDTLPVPGHPKRLPEILDVQEVENILEAAPSPKYRAAFMAVYGCGLRTKELCHLAPAQVDAARGVLRVNFGKGGKDRPIKLPQILLLELRQCWRTYKPESFIFEGKIPGQPISPSAVQRAFRDACRKAGISKRVSLYSLRHAYATHLLESGENIRRIQALLGHQSLNTTAVYTHLARTWLDEVKSPLDSLKLGSKKLKK